MRHVVCAEGVYNEGLRERVTSFGRNHEHYTGGLDRESLVAALRQKDAALERSLAEIQASRDADFTVEFHGRRSLAAHLNVYGTHEALHHGQWSPYAAFGGFETPPGWKLNWGL